jgi:DNA repair exonuclease SbcCD ATPase subunit
MIQEIEAYNVKGREFAHKLSPVTMFLGDNGKGKTARLAAIRLALYGHDPVKGTTMPASTWKLAGNVDNKMFVKATTTLGRIRRDWELKSNKVAFRSELPPGYPEDAQALPDSRAFFALKTANSRRDFIFNAFQIGDGEYSPTSLITKFKTITIDDMTDYHTAELEELVSHIMDSSRNRTLELKANKEYPFQKWLAEIGEYLKDELKIAKETVERMSQGIEATTQLQASEGQAVSRPIEAINSDIAANQKVLDDLNQEYGKLKASAEQEAKKAQEREYWKAELAKCPEQKVGDIASVRAAHNVLTARRATMRQKQEDLNRRLAELDKELTAEQAKDRLRNSYQATLARTEPVAEKLAAARAELARLNQLVSAYQDKRPSLQGQRNAMEQNIISTDAEVIALDQKLAKLKSAYEHTIQGDCCPTCKLQGKAWVEAYTAWYSSEFDRMTQERQVKKTRYDAFVADSKTLMEAVNAANQEAKEHSDQCAQARSIDATIQQYERTQKNLDAASAELDRLGEPGIDAIKEKQDALRTELQAVNKEYEGDGKSYDEVEKNLKELEKQEAQQQRRKELTAKLETLGEAVPVDYAGMLKTMEEKIETVAKDNNDLQKEKDNAAASQQDELRKQQSQQELEKSKARVAVLKAAREIQQEFQRDVVTGVFKTLVITANKLVGSILKSPLEYRDGIIGRTENDMFIEEVTFSGIDEMMTYIAFAVALTPNALCRTIIQDEMGTLSPRNRWLFLQEMVKAAKSGIIHQFIGADPDVDCYKPFDQLSGVNFITID